MTTTRRKFFGKLGLLAAAAVGVKAKSIKEVSCNDYTRGSGGAFKCRITPNAMKYTLKSSEWVTQPVTATSTLGRRATTAISP